MIGARFISLTGHLGFRRFLHSDGVLMCNTSSPVLLNTYQCTIHDLFPTSSRLYAFSFGTASRSI
jgi:hypothetical protein